jgi:hypothetical protein
MMKFFEAKEVLCYINGMLTVNLLIALSKEDWFWVLIDTGFIVLNYVSIKTKND